MTKSRKKTPKNARKSQIYVPGKLTDEFDCPWLRWDKRLTSTKPRLCHTWSSRLPRDVNWKKREKCIKKNINGTWIEIWNRYLHILGTFGSYRQCSLDAYFSVKNFGKLLKTVFAYCCQHFLISFYFVWVKIYLRRPQFREILI